MREVGPEEGFNMHEEMNWPEPETVEIGDEWFTFKYEPLGDYTVGYWVGRSDGLYFDGTPAEPEQYLAGQIKWDGCADFFVGPDEGMYNMHFCNVQQWKNLGTVMEKVYRTASELNVLRDKELCKGWDD